MAMKTLLWVTMICLASSSLFVTSLPAPAHAMMVHGFLLRQPGNGGYTPQAGMTAYASRFYNSRTSLVNENPDAEPPAEEEAPTPEDTPVEQEAPEVEKAAEAERAPEEHSTKAPERTPKAERAPTPSKPKAPKPPKRRPAEEDEDEEDDDYTPGRRNQGGPSYSNFFPIVFGSRTVTRRGGRAGEEDETLQGPGLTAIANSFSTGRGAIAASHATAYGGPAPAAPTNQYRKGSPSRYRS